MVRAWPAVVGEGKALTRNEGHSRLLISTEAVLSPLSAVAASSQPSPLKSAAARPEGYEPTAELTADRKLPSPPPRSTLTSKE